MKRRFPMISGVVVVCFLAFIAGRFTGGKPHQLPPDSRRILYYVDPMHPSYRSDRPGIAPDCGMALEPVYEEKPDAVAQKSLPAGGVAVTAERQQLIGLQVYAARRSTGLRTVRTTGRIVPDDSRLYRVQAGFDGWVDSLADTPPGTIVKADQVLATLYGPEIRNAQLNYVAFISGIERVRQNQPDTDAAQVNESKRVSEEQLKLMGMGEKDISELGKSHRVSNTLNLVSPGDGVVLARSISPRQRFEKGAELYRIADLRKVWIVADVHGNEIEFKPGMRARVQVPELATTFDATVSSAVPLFDEASRTLKVRLIAENRGLALRPDMFVDVEFDSRVPQGLLIPASAVLDSGRRKIVYVETADGVFEPRSVELSGNVGDQVIVAAGIRDGERVVVSGNFLLDSESRMRGSDSSADRASSGQSGAQPNPNTTDGIVDAHGLNQVRDPVCHMLLTKADVTFRENYRGKTFSFCSDSCRKKFLADPERYAGKDGNLAGIAGDGTFGPHDRSAD